MDATQMISDSILESDEDETEEENENKRGKPLAKLCILKNDHIPERELPLFLGENVLGRDPNTCTLSLPSSSISKQHATISISVYRRRGRPSEADMEALVWDLGSLNGTRKGRLKLTPNVRYALGECDSLVLADIPCQYVISSAERASPQDQFKTPTSRGSGAKATVADASNENGSGNKKCVNGASESRVGLPDVEDRGNKTAVRSCLSFEQTPTQPQGTLVPESDLDSDDEGGGRGDWRHKTLASDSDSSKVTPTSSTLLSPLNKTVPESEDESPITPPDSAKNRPHRYVSFTKEETDANVGRQELKEKDACEEEEEEGAAPEGRKSVESGHPVPVNKDGNISLEGADESPVSASAVFPNAIPAFNMDSDTDVEGEEEGVPSALPVTLNTSPQADHPSETAQLHMDSDTDVDESDDNATSDKRPESVPSSDSITKPSHVVPVIQPDDISMDSDTDMEEDAVSKAEPASFQSTHPDNAAATTPPKDFNLDSDTDVDEEHENEKDQTPSGLDAKPLGTKPAPTAPPIPQTDSETDDEATTGISAATETRTTADTRADLEILSDSDADVKDDSPKVVPVAVATLPFTPGAVPGAVQPESDADTDVDESSGPPAGDRVSPAGFHMDSETDEEDVGAAAENQVPNLHRENTPGFQVPSLQKCSTPVQLLAGEMDRMETQDFLSPSSAPFRCAESPATRSKATASGSDSQEDESLVVAETQSFVLQARGHRSGFSDGHIMNPAQGFDSESSVDEGSEKSARGASFQLGLSDSSHLQDRAQALAMESTQAFVPVDNTGAHAATSHPERVSSDNGLSEAATQAYVEDEEPSRCPVTTRQEGQVDLALEATQAYISDLRNDSEDETDEDETKNIACVETQAFELPTSSTLAMAETLPMCALEEEGSQNDTEDGKAVPSLDEAQTQPIAQTQPMPLSDDEEINDEDSVPVLRKRKAKPLLLEDEQTQPLASRELALVETQPMVTGEDEESDDEGSIIGLRKRKAKPLQTQEEESQTLSLTAGETQPTVTDEDGESEDVDSFPGLHKRKARPLQIQEDSQSEVSTSETNTVCQRGHGGQTDAENSGVAGSRGARARLRTEEELTECAESPKRQMRVKTKSTEKSRPSENESGEEEEEEEEKGEQRKQAGGKSEKKNDEEEGNKLSQNGSLVKEQEAIPEQKDVSDLRQETERADEERRQMDERGKKLEESQQRREEEEKLKREKKEREEEKERMVAEHAERSKLEKERAEKETIERKRKEEEDKERAERMKKEKEEQLLRNKKEKEDKERLELEKAEREQKERLEREEKARLESERKEKEEKDRLQNERRKQEETLEREEEEPEPQVSLQSEAKAQEGGERSEREKEEKATEEQQENKPTVPPRGRRAARRTIAALCTAEPQQDSTTDDVPARRTRSRSNSSNSVSSERSAASLDSQQSKGRGRGRGRGAKRTSEPPSAVIPRSSSRRKTVAALPAEQDGSDISRSNSSNSINSDFSSNSLSSRGRGRGGRQRARGRQAEADSATLISNQSDQSPAPKPKGRNRRSNKAEESVNASCREDEEKTGAQQAATTRGQWRASSDGSEPASNENPLHQDERGANKSSPPSQRNIRARSQKEMKSESTEAEVSPSGSHEAEAGEKRRGRKRVSEANTEEAASSSSKISKGTVREQAVAEEDEEAKGQPQDEIPVQANRGGRAAISQTKRSAKGSPAEAEVKIDDVRTEEAAVGRRVRGRSSVAHQKKKDEQEGSNSSSVDLDACAVKSEQPQTPASGASRKRRAPADSSPLAKTPRSSSGSPAASGQSRSSCQTYKVLFTGVVDEAGERVLARLGGSMAKGVADMNCLVTDKVRRTVKFLCALAKGVPIVTTHWLEKSGKAGSFLSPASFVVKDPEQEMKFNFSLQESLRVASNQPLLQGYEIHVTKSVRPEPVHMKDILTCSGATFLPKMPTSHKPQTVVISCEEDWQLCGPALSASVPVVTAEFILTGILQQKLDVQTHSLSAPANIPQPVGGRGRGRRKT